MTRIICEFIGSFLAVIFVSVLLFIHVVFGVVFGVAFIWLIVRGHQEFNKDDSWLIDERWEEPWTQDQLWKEEVDVNVDNLREQQRNNTDQLSQITPSEIPSVEDLKEFNLLLQQINIKKEHNDMLEKTLVAYKLLNRELISMKPKPTQQGKL